MCFQGPPGVQLAAPAATRPSEKHYLHVVCMLKHRQRVSVPTDVKAGIQALEERNMLLSCPESCSFNTRLSKLCSYASYSYCIRTSSSDCLDGWHDILSGLPAWSNQSCRPVVALLFLKSSRSIRNILIWTSAKFHAKQPPDRRNKFEKHTRPARGCRRVEACYILTLILTGFAAASRHFNRSLRLIYILKSYFVNRKGVVRPDPPNCGTTTMLHMQARVRKHALLA
jgi:hypothetical protein